MELGRWKQNELQVAVLESAPIWITNQFLMNLDYLTPRYICRRPQEGDAAFAGCAALAAAGDERLAAVRAANERCGRLAEDVDNELALARDRVQQRQGLQHSDEVVSVLIGRRLGFFRRIGRKAFLHVFDVVPERRAQPRKFALEVLCH